MSRFRIGCSGWQYKHWKGDFYSADLPKREWLEYYAQRFDTVEVNNSCTPSRAPDPTRCAVRLTSNNAPAFVYFNNDIGGHAPRDAKRLLELLAPRQHLDGAGMDRDVPMAIG